MAARGASAALVLKAEANKHRAITKLHCSDIKFEAFEPFRPKSGEMRVALDAARNWPLDTLEPLDEP